MKILYVCPWAHLPSHNPHFIAKESAAFLQAGVDVVLCTFQGILDNKESTDIIHKKVTSTWYGYPLGLLSRLLHSSMKLRLIAGFIEQSVTLFLAVKLRKSQAYDFIFLREGDPFIFLPILLGLVHSNYRWVISLIGTKSVRSPRNLYYRFINAGIWKPIYRRSLSRNRFIFICENDDIKENFEVNFLDGMLAGLVKVIAPGIKAPPREISQREARSHLNLPKDKVFFLHFGALHPGKDIETVISAIKDVENAELVIAGKVYSVDLVSLVQHYDIQDKCVIRNYYISEADKQYYFAASDAIILSYRKSFSQTASQAWEAVGFKLPVIASGSYDLGQMVRNYKIGLSFSAEDALSLNNALKTFIGLSQTERQTFKENCEKLSAEFSMQRWTEKFIEVTKLLYD
ncbi:MAG: glycosyltransferase [Dehalococcoidia bacterium]